MSKKFWFLVHWKLMIGFGQTNYIRDHFLPRKKIIKKKIK
jgi:hypothetical protein